MAKIKGIQCFTTIFNGDGNLMYNDFFQSFGMKYFRLLEKINLMSPQSFSIIINLIANEKNEVYSEKEETNKKDQLLWVLKPFDFVSFNESTLLNKKKMAANVVFESLLFFNEQQKWGIEAFISKVHYNLVQNLENLDIPFGLS